MLLNSVILIPFFIDHWNLKLIINLKLNFWFFFFVARTHLTWFSLKYKDACLVNMTIQWGFIKYASNVYYINIDYNQYVTKKKKRLQPIQHWTNTILSNKKNEQTPS